MKTKHLKLLERYFNGEMTPAEMVSLEESLHSDPELNAAFREYQLITEALSDQDTIDLRGKLKDIRDEYNRGRSGRDFLSHNNNWVWLAALLVMVICFTIVLSMLISVENQRKQLLTMEHVQFTSRFSYLDLELMKYGSRNHDLITLESPKDSCIFDRSPGLVFSWRTDTTLSLKLDIISRDGMVVFTTRQNIESPYYLPGVFPEGFYVFRLRDDSISYYQGIMYLK
ncbi:MAG: hypothetical protein K0B08_04825 [Bacteroidales bacterium]|nr:hypothetical protein [Bacteroidales bacterium]